LARNHHRRADSARKESNPSIAFANTGSFDLLSPPARAQRLTTSGCFPSRLNSDWRRCIPRESGTDRLVRWIGEELGKDTYLNLMAQYRPKYKAFDHPAIARRLTNEEWKQAVTWAKEAGLENLHA
jgi:hypothetical protein